MIALLTDDEIAGSAWKWGRDQPSIHLPDLVVGFENGARFARSIYEARLAEDAKRLALANELHSKDLRKHNLRAQLAVLEEVVEELNGFSWAQLKIAALRKEIEG